MTAAEMRVLIVEDDVAVRRIVTDQLESRGVGVVPAGTVAASREALRRADFDTVILDRMLPDGSGLEILAELRESGSSAHVIVLTGARSEADRVHAIEHGADDYVVKPFFARELAARVLAVERRRHLTEDTTLRIGALEIDVKAQQVTADGGMIDLTSKEFALLAFMAASPGRTFSRDELLRAVWQSNADWQQSATVTEHVRRLRMKIEEDPRNPTVLMTVHGAGYRLDLPAVAQTLVQSDDSAEPDAGALRRSFDQQEFEAYHQPVATLAEEHVRHRARGRTATALRRSVGLNGVPEEVARSGPTHDDQIGHDSVSGMLRGLLRVRTPEGAVELLHQTVRQLGGRLVLASRDPIDALPIDVSLGEGPPMLAIAEPFSIARMQLERILPRLVEDARQAIDLLRRAERITEEADVDELTGLGSARVLGRVVSSFDDGTIVMVDLDCSKVDNDNHGHGTGDGVLARFGRMLEDEVPAGDTICRVRGEEFAIVLLGADLKTATELVDRLRETWTLVAPLRVTFSVGMAEVSVSGGTAALLAADRALCRAKSNGRNRTEISIDVDR